MIGFLAENGYDGLVTSKTLANPSNKDFQNIFKFAYSFIDPTPFTRFEDDAISVIKMLKYPYSSEITRSQLSVVTPHTWPVLLSMLSWLIDLIKQAYIQEDPTKTIEELFFEYVCDGYTRFMEGDDREEEHDTEFVERIEAMHAREAEVNESMRRQHRQLELELEEYKKQFGGIAELETRKKKIVEDLNTLISHEHQLENKKSRYMASIEKLAEEIKEYEQSIENLIQIKNDILSQINQQTVNPDDIKGMNAEKVNLFKELERMKPEREAVVRNLMKAEGSLAEKIEENERIITELQGISQMRMIEDELNELKSLNAAAGTGQDLLCSREIGALVLQKLEEAVVNRRESLVNYEIHVATLEENISDSAMHLQDLEEQHEHLGTKLKTIGAIYLEKKEIADRTRLKSRSDMDRLDNDLLKLKLEGDSVYLRSEKECSEAKIKLDVLLSNIGREREEVSKLVWHLYNTVSQQLKALDQLRKDVRTFPS